MISKGSCFIFTPTLRHFFWISGLVVLVGIPSLAQTYSPIFILNSSNAETDSAEYSGHPPGNSLGMGLVAYTPAIPGFDYRWSAAFQERKFKLEYASDSLERRYALTTLDLGVGLSTELLEMFGFFVGVEGTLMSKAKCRGTSPCNEGGGDSIAAQVQAGFSLRIGFMKLEPYWEHMPFSPIDGTKSLTSYGLAVHFLPESFSAD